VLRGNLQTRYFYPYENPTLAGMICHVFSGRGQDELIAARRGFASAAEMRRAGRNPRSLEAYLALPQAARESRSASERALRLARERRQRIDYTVAESGTTVEDVAFWFARAVIPTELSGTFAMPEDRYLRVRTYISTEGERVFVAARGSAEARRAEDANALQWRYVHNEATEAELARIRGLVVDGVEAAADAKTLLEVARRGEFDPAEIYRELV
jgi:hypothetical protein